MARSEILAPASSDGADAAAPVPEVEAAGLLSPDPLPADRLGEAALRPRSLGDFVGQSELKGHLDVLLGAASKRREPVDHLLFAGPPGLGKTTLAHIVANELDAHLQTTSGPALERSGDLAAMLTKLESGDVLFIDEIHRLPRPVEEVLYPAMEDFRIDIVLGKGPAARSIPLDLAPFTLVGATTRTGLITGPLRDRFGLVARLDFYAVDDLVSIVERTAGILDVTTDTGGATEIARRARGTPRIATACCDRCATSPRCTETAGSTRRWLPTAWTSSGSTSWGSTGPRGPCWRPCAATSAAVLSGCPPWR